MYESSSYCYLESAMNVGKSLPIGIVAMNSKGLHGDNLRDGLQEFTEGSRGTDTDGVSKRDLVASHIVQLFRDLGDLASSDGALIWTTHNTGDISNVVSQKTRERERERERES